MRKKNPGFLFSFIILSGLLASCSLSSLISDSSSLTSLPASGTSETASSSGSDSPSESGSSSSSASSESTVSSSTSALANSEDYTSFWSYGSDIKITLSFANKSLYAVSKYGAYDKSTWYDLYFPADFSMTVNGEAYAMDEVGVRMKGNTSRRVFCSEDGTISDPINLKLSFKCTFEDELYSKNAYLKQFQKDWTDDAAGKAARKNRTLFDMDKMDLKYIPRNEKLSPYCNSQEVYCYEAFRKEGLIAPHSNIVQLVLESGSDSVTYSYEAVECIDKTMMKRYFNKADSKGDLYKCTCNTPERCDFGLDGAVDLSVDDSGNAIGSRLADGTIGVEDNYDDYHPLYDLKTNDDAGNDGSFVTMVNFLNKLNDVAENGGSQALLESILDVDQFLRFSALTQCLGSFDDQRYNYNNFYLYFVPSTAKAIYIPYDFDWSLGLDLSKGIVNRGAYDETDTRKVTNYNHIYNATIFKSTSMAYSKTSYQKAYSSYIAADLDDGILTYSNYTSLADRFDYADHGEYSIVETYMAKKTTVLRNSI